MSKKAVQSVTRPLAAVATMGASELAIGAADIISQGPQFRSPKDNGGGDGAPEVMSTKQVDDAVQKKEEAEISRRYRSGSTANIFSLLGGSSLSSAGISRRTLLGG